MKRPLQIHTVEIQTSSYYVADNGKVIDTIEPTAWRIDYLTKPTVTRDMLMRELEKSYPEHRCIEIHPMDRDYYSGAAYQHKFFKLTYIRAKENKKLLHDYLISDLMANNGWCEYRSTMEVQ